jgi:hypothetical protein
LTLANVTPPLTEGAGSYPQNLLGGTLVAVVKFHRNRCYKANLTGEYASPENNVKRVVGCRAGKEPPSLDVRDMDIDDSYEDIVVSAPMRQFSLNAGANTTLTFDFSAHPVPLDSSDLYLQVVYRGPIGPDAINAEQDVVAVGTKDISEPTYFAFFNSSDYIDIGGVVYTRSEVAAAQNLLKLVKPAACVSGTSQNLKLSPSCFVAQNLAVNISFVSNGTPQIKVAALPKRRYLSVAYLTDAALPSGMSTAAGAARDSQGAATNRIAVTHRAERRMPQGLLRVQLSSACISPPQYDIPPLWNQFVWGARDPDPAKPEPPPQYRDQAMSYLRGIEGYFQVYCVLSGDGKLVASSDKGGGMTALDANAGETAPYPATIVGVFGP